MESLIGVLDSSSAYHLCRDREVLSAYATCEGCIWMAYNTTSRVVGKESVWFRMIDGRSMMLTEFLRKTRRFCGKRRLEGYTDWRGVSRQGELLSDMGPVVLARRMDKGSNCCTEARKASAETRGVQLVQDVHRKPQRKETKSNLRSCIAKGAAMVKRVSFALDLISGGDLSSCAHKGGEMEPRQLAKSYGEAGPEAVRMDNLKTSDYPLVGWKGRLLSLAHLDESKPTWMSPSPVAKPKPGVDMDAEDDPEVGGALLEEVKVMVKKECNDNSVSGDADQEGRKIANKDNKRTAQLMVVDEMPMKNWIAWNSMIHGYARDGCPREAVRLFRELNSDPYAESRGDIFMLATVFGACTDLAALDCGKQIHARIIIDEVEFDSILASSLINLYGKVSSLGISENCKQMHARACKFGISDDLIITSALVDTAGCLEEAMSLIEEISFEADASMWSSVLRGCVTHGDKSLAKRLAKQITDLDPENSGAYMQLSSILATSGA
ncbi:pentatricopeptide repeat (PPR) superfamily protein [Actinidia rufa]|uniref:Pentatricopeptide repeat (PPR) superfamily protein n=1 Tax=Actinidia rufa TaxID=165716 RepID=A0A7J0EH81_9ERIC|nr:pentatricopeptide repeat (PPR) superfamily protein [Actinidia rufa]